MKDADREYVADEQHRQDDPRRLARAKEEREDQHVDEAHAREPRLTDADAGRGDDRQSPLSWGEVRQ